MRVRSAVRVASATRRRRSASARAAGPQPAADDPHDGEREEEEDVLVRRLVRAAPVDRDRQRDVRHHGGDHGGAAVAFQVGARADQRDGEREGREGVVAAELVDGEAERHQREAEGRPPAADDEREAFEGDRDDGEGVVGLARHAVEPRPAAPERGHQGEGEQQQGKREIPDRDVVAPPQVRDPPELDHWASVAVGAGAADRRRGITLPRRWASHMNTTVSAAPNPTAYRLPSGPNSPPVTRADPDVSPFSRPSDSPLPETWVPKTPPWAKFHAKCRPIGSHRLRVAA